MDIEQASVVKRDGALKLRIAFKEGGAIEIPLSDQVAMVLNAGGWMMREHVARTFERDLKSTNLVSRRVRQISLGPIELPAGESSVSPAPPTR